VLGDMRELGPQSPRFHAELAGPIGEAGIDLVHACGPLMRHLHEAIPQGNRGAYAASAAELEPLILDTLKAGDVVAVKGSLGSRMGPIVQALRTRFGAPQEKSRPPC
jgi:UDP-N-acetylmuramoyl-tripeptide--D-alanyl-D-alanine ligase